MDKNAIKKYAIWARRELIEKVSQKALQYGIEEGKELDPKLDSINGVLLSDDEKKQRQALIHKINENGYTQVMEEVAYTWFNRFIALRFMEVNGYLPSHVRVFTDEAGEFKPQIMSEALHLELEGLDMEKVYELKNDNRDDDLFKYLLITQCNALSGIFPKMFQKIADYTELLLPDYLLREGSVIEQMVNQKDGILEDDWKDQVQIIGWLYQFYNIEPKDKAFADLKKKIKINKTTLPAATQLFTPDWIVHYMVENSLGRLWLEGHPNDTLKGEWKYYLDEAEQEPGVQKQLEEIHKEYAGLKPEEIRCIDPCMGSGHVLCVLFDTLIKIYEDYGYSARDAAASIVENNLWGLDIDERAAQLAYFAVMMKARQYDRRFLTRGIQPHVYAIEESNGLAYDGDYSDFLLDKNQQETLSYMLGIFSDAKEYGSILDVKAMDYDGFLEGWNQTAEQTFSDVRMLGWYMYAGDKIAGLAYQAKTLSQKYHVVVTNPPYMGVGGMSSKLSTFVKKEYPDSKSDLFSVFIEKGIQMTLPKCYTALITQHVWMFISSYEKLRGNLENITIVNMAHLGARAFEEISGEVVQTTSFVMRKLHNTDYYGKYIRLVDEQSQNAKEEAFLMKDKFFVEKYKEFEIVPGTPIAYWLSDDIRKTFVNMSISEISEIKQGLATCNNNLFLRNWYEVARGNIGFGFKSSDETLSSDIKWFPYNKGGGYRKWYGNGCELVNWKHGGEDIHKYNNIPLDYQAAPVRAKKFYFRSGITYGLIASTGFSARDIEGGFVFDVGGSMLFPPEDKKKYILGFLNTNVAQEYLKAINPTLNYQVGDIGKLPLIWNEQKAQIVTEIVDECISLCKSDWDDYETSWDFSVNPIVKQGEPFIKSAINKWMNECETRIDKLKTNEEKLNSLFVDIYGVSKDISVIVDDDRISIRKPSVSECIRLLIMYAVGCMFGRYSLDKQGIVFAGGQWDVSEYKSFIPDKDGIIPICDDEYFEDDIVGRFVAFIENAFGKEFLEENLRYISEIIGGNGTPREIIRSYFINDFYSDHLKVYQKRPIYWLFDSGKKNGFKCLMYIHRYKTDTVAKIRTDYVHEQQSRYKTAIEEIDDRINNTTGNERIKLSKRKNDLLEQEDEIRDFEEKIHHIADQMIEIDLDDGVRKNYSLFKDVLAKI